MASGLKSQDKIHILFRIGFTIDFFKEKQVEKNSDLITKLTGGSPIMERHLIGAAELLCVPKPKLFAVLIKQLYEEDCLEEDVILEWACEGRSDYTLDAVDEDSRAALRGEAEPVVVWLQDDDSDGDDSDSDSD
jgi:translation initiation factor 5